MSEFEAPYFKFVQNLNEGTNNQTHIDNCHYKQEINIDVSTLFYVKNSDITAVSKRFVVG